MSSNNLHKQILHTALNWAERNNYSGYSKFDALNSPILKKIAGNNYYLKAGFIYLISRANINIRPMLFVKKKQNPKGLALFARCYFNLYSITKEEKYLSKGIELIKLLLTKSQVDKFSGHCWGYDHPWQNQAFYAPQYYPNTVVTVVVCEAILDAYALTKDTKYLNIAKSVYDFTISNLTTIIDNDKYSCSSYIPNNAWKVINVNALLGCLFSRLYKYTNDNKYFDHAKRYINWVASTQTDYGAWFYTDPPDRSPITHDNYHTGFVLDSIFDYMENTGDRTYEEAYLKGLDYYRGNLFTDQYAPKWMYNKTYPHDIHGVAQGIITFTKANKYNSRYLKVAENIANWGIQYLYNGDGRFLYQKGKYWTKSFTLMRWCQGWMCYALSNYLIAANVNRD